MPLSISDSERRSATRAIAVLLTLLAAYFGVLEMVTRIGFPRINHVWRTIQADHRTAVSLRPALAHSSATMLIVGNSYLELGVNRDNLQQEIAPAYSVAYLPIQGTSYLDWYFGLRRLFAEGSRPAIVGVCLSTRDLISDATSGEPFAHSLMLEHDILKVRVAGRLDNTTTSDYFFANFSSWLGHRGEGMLVVLPYQHAELPESAFLDGSHLNPRGAALFTERLGPTLLHSLYRN